MTPVYLTVLNLFLCSIWGGGAFMRLHVTHSNVIGRIRLIYAGMLMAACASGFRLQLFGEYAGYADLTVSATMVGFIWLGSKRWRYGAPSDLMKHHSILR